MRRRTFLLLIGGAVASPLAASAQTMQVVKRVAIADPAQATTEMIETGKSAFYRGFFGELRRLGFVEGQNLIVERYSGHGSANLPNLAREVVRTKPDCNPGILASTGAAIGGSHVRNSDYCRGDT